MREGRRGNRGVVRHVEVADVVQRESSSSCAGEPYGGRRCRVVNVESSRPCAGCGFAVSTSRCHVSRVVYCVVGKAVWPQRCLKADRDIWNLQLLLACHHRRLASTDPQSITSGPQKRGEARLGRNAQSRDDMVMK